MTRSTRTFTLTVQAAPAVPSWVSSLTTGQITGIGSALTTLQPNDLPANQAIGQIFAYCGGVYAPTLGNYGSLIVWGGGHTNWYYSGAYRFDLETLAWTQLVDEYTAFVVGDGRGFYSDTTYGEWYTTAGGAVGGVPIANHTYGRAVYLPPGTLGSDPKGYYCIPTLGTVSTAPYYYVVPSTRWMHYIPLSNPQWLRGPQLPDAASANTTIYGVSMYDSARNRLVYVPCQSGSSTTTRVQWYDFDNATSGTITTTAFKAAYGAGFYDSASDLYMVTTSSTYAGFQVLLINPSTGALTAATMTNAPVAAGIGNTDTGGFEWIQDLGRLIYYPGFGQTFWWAQKPANPLTETWAWQQATMTGSATTQLVAQHYNRFKWIDSLGVFVWLPGGSGQQALKYSGFT